MEHFDAEEVQSWLEHPVTREFMDRLKEHREMARAGVRQRLSSAEIGGALDAIRFEGVCEGIEDAIDIARNDLTKEVEGEQEGS